MSRPYIPDLALEASRRAGWARYFATRAALNDEQLVTAELAAWVEHLAGGIPAPLADLFDRIREDHDRHTLTGITRYVRAVAS